MIGPDFSAWFDLITPHPSQDGRPLTLLERSGIRLACRVILEHDEETTPPDVGCYECTLGMVLRTKETGPCLYHAACEFIREAGLEP